MYFSGTLVYGTPTNRAGQSIWRLLHPSEVLFSFGEVGWWEIILDNYKVKAELGDKD